MAYILKTSQSFQKDFGKLDSVMQTRVLTALEKMKTDPLIDSKKLINVPIGVFRRRIGDYRLRFDISGHEIYLYRIRHRKEVYRK